MRGGTLPGYVQEEFAAYLKCGRLEHGFLRVCCTACHAERLVAFSCKRRGFCPSYGRAVRGCVLGIPHCENPTRRPAFPAAQPAATPLGHGYRGSPASRRAATLA